MKMFNDINSIASLVSIDVTSHSAIPPFVKDCNNCNSGFMSANAGCTSTATADFKTERLDPHQEQDIRSYSMADVRACGDLEAAIVLGQIRFWWPRKLNKHRGVKKSYADWKDELGISKEKVQRINDVLVKCGMVEIYFDTWGHFKSKATFYILTAKALAIKPPVGKPPMLSIAQGGKSPMVAKAQAGNPPITENTKDTENTKNQTLNSVATKPATTSIQDLQQAAEAAGVMNKTTPVQPSPAKQPEPAQPGQFEEPYIGPDKTKTLPNGKQPSKAVKHWMLVYEQTYGEKPPKPLRPAMRNFHHALNVSMRDAINGESLAFIDFVFANYTKGRNLLWNSRCVAGVDLHLRNRPMMEDISKHREFFTQQYLAFRDGPAIKAKEHAAYAAKQAAKDAAYEEAKKEKAAKAKAEPVHVPVTLEQIAEMEAEFEAEYAAKKASLSAPATVPVPVSVEPEVPHQPSAETLAEEAAWTADILKSNPPFEAQPATVPASVTVELEAGTVVSSSATASLETGCPVIEYAVLPLVPEVLPSYEEAHAWWLESVAKKAAADAEAKKKAKHYHA